MIHLKTALDRRRTKKDGSHPILMRITVNGKVRDISTGFTCTSTQWNSKTCNVKCSTPALEITYERIKEQYLTMLNKVKEYEQKYPDKRLYDVNEVRSFLSGKIVQQATVKSLWQEEIELMKKSGRYGNARSYTFSLSGLELVRPLNVPFNKITYKWLTEVEAELLGKGLKPNSVGVYYRTLRAVYNKAINVGLVDQNLYPFRRFKIKNGKTAPRNLMLGDMRRFFNYVPTDKKTEYAHDIGKLIFMLRGINFTDLLLLEKSNLRNDRLIYHRAKTHKLYNVKVEPDAMKLIEKYRSYDGELLLGLLSLEQYTKKQELQRHLAQKRKHLNKWLKRVGEDIGLPIKLSTYVFRYSFAGACRELGYSKDLISQALGHQNTNGAAVTDRYLNDYDNKVIDDMSRHVLDAVINTEF